jgi:PadR family transcriptional regulator, regulatory protein PadR
MGSRSEFSVQTLSVLTALCEQPSQWRHGYELAKQTGLKSGTLYPILIRLTDRGLMEAHWQDEQPVGRPRRHLYRLTPEGLAAASAAVTAMASPRGAAAPSPARTSPSPRRLPAQA